MTYREIIESVPTDRRREAESYFKGMCDGYGISLKNAAVDERKASSEEKPFQTVPVVDKSAIDWSKI